MGNAELTLGGIDDTKFTGKSFSTSVSGYALVDNVDAGITGELVYTPILDESHWTITSTHIFVNGQTVDILSQNLTQIADSGTSNMLLPTNITEVFICFAPVVCAR